MEDFKAKGKTISEIREAKVELEKNILSLIQKFEEETETHVRYVELDYVQMLKNPLPNTVNVEVEFKF